MSNPDFCEECVNVCILEIELKFKFVTHDDRGVKTRRGNINSHSVTKWFVSVLSYRCNELSCAAHHVTMVM
jgi:hypothetical protein